VLGDTLMFNKSKYTKWYYNIVEAAKHRNVDGYVERHHIIPRSLGGSNDADNLVALTAREHFIVHHLLCYMLDSTKQRKKMENAIGKFVQTNESQERNLTARQYEVCRTMLAKAMSGRRLSNSTKQKIREARAQQPDPRLGTTHSEESKQKIREARARQDMSYRKGKQIGSAGLTGDANVAKRPDVRAKIAESKIGDKNPMKAKAGKVIMINDGKVTKYHDKTQPVPEGWRKGRVKTGCV